MTDITQAMRFLLPEYAHQITCILEKFCVKRRVKNWTGGEERQFSMSFNFEESENWQTCVNRKFDMLCAELEKELDRLREDVIWRKMECFELPKYEPFMCAIDTSDEYAASNRIVFGTAFLGAELTINIDIVYRLVDDD